MKITTKLILQIGASVIFSPSLIAQNKNVSYESFDKGFNIIRTSFQEAGGRTNINQIENITLHYQELNSSRGQNKSHDDSSSMQEGGDSKLIYDVTNNQSHHQRYFQRRGRLFDPILVLKDQGSFFYWPETQELNTTLNTDVIKSAFNFRYTYPQRLFPHVLLQNAIQNKATIRWVGDKIQNGVMHNIVNFVHNDGALITLYINSQTSLITKTEELFNDFLKGDVIGHTIYTDYIKKNDVLIPNNISFTLSGEIIRKMLIKSVEINTDIDPSTFVTPQGMSQSDYQPAFKPQHISNGVFFMPLFNGTGIPYNSMFVVFEDHVMVFDAPLSDLISHIYINIIGKVAPGKPVKYIVPTHHHSDHIGGIRRFMGQDATVVTTKKNEQFFKDIAKTKARLSPIPLTFDPSLITIDTIKSKKVYSDGTQAVEIYNVGPSPHAEEILVAYVPSAKVLYVTDLLWIPLVDGHYPAARKALLEFGKAIKKIDLDIEVIVPGHGKMGDINDLHNALKVVEYRTMNLLQFNTIINNLPSLTEKQQFKALYSQ